jgi:hypothetical protein
MEQYWVRSPLTEARLARYHEKGLLPGNMEYFIIDNEFLRIENNQLVTFESHLECAMGFPPSRFLVFFCRHYVLELVHPNPNAIAALSVFVVLCVCWLGIEPRHDLFRYFYTASYASKELIHTVGFNLRRSRISQYIPGKSKGSWKGAWNKWFIIDVGK